VDQPDPSVKLPDGFDKFLVKRALPGPETYISHRHHADQSFKWVQMYFLAEIYEAGLSDLKD